MTRTLKDMRYKTAKRRRRAVLMRQRARQYARLVRTSAKVGRLRRDRRRPEVSPSERTEMEDVT
jgi:hypothetical protein